jgi:hypothetical protein
VGLGCGVGETIGGFGLGPAGRPAAVGLGVTANCVDRTSGVGIGLVQAVSAAIRRQVRRMRRSMD